MFRYIIIIIYEVPTALRWYAPVQKLVGSKYRKIRAYNFWRCLYSEGIIHGRKFTFQNRLGSLAKVSAPSQEPLVIKTASTVYFILGILRTDF